MDEHQNLVNSLIVAFQNRGYTILKAAATPYHAPGTIGRHEPDILAIDQQGVLIIGEAKTGSDISNQTSKEQFLDFSNRIMSEGPLRGAKIPLHLIVTQEHSTALRQVLATLGLSNKIGESIFIWTK